jgi:hypothetical protein
LKRVLYSTSLVTREMQIKAAMRCRIANMKEMEIPNAGKDAQQWEHSGSVSRGVTASTTFKNG